MFVLLIGRFYLIPSQWNSKVKIAELDIIWYKTQALTADKHLGATWYMKTLELTREIMFISNDAAHISKFPNYLFNRGTDAYSTQQLHWESSNN